VLKDVIIITSNILQTQKNAQMLPQMYVKWLESFWLGRA